MSEGYRYMNHTADIELLAYADDIDGLYRNALLAMFNTIADVRKLEKDKSKVYKFDINAEVEEGTNSTEDLAWETLQSALSQAEAKGLFAFKIDKPVYKYWRKRYMFSATCYAKKKNPKFAKFEVKGVSKFDLKFKEKGINYKNKGHNFEITVVLDV